MFSTNYPSQKSILISSLNGKRCTLKAENMFFLYMHICKNYIKEYLTLKKASKWGHRNREKRVCQKGKKGEKVILWIHNDKAGWAAAAIGCWIYVCLGKSIICRRSYSWLCFRISCRARRQRFMTVHRVSPMARIRISTNYDSRP